MKQKELFLIWLSFLALEFSNTFLAVDVDMHCQKVANGFLAVDVLFGVACCFSALDLELFGVGCCFSALDVLFGVGLKNPLPLSGVEWTLGDASKRRRVDAC